MKYDKTRMAERYDSARRLSGATMSVWLDAIRARVAPDDVRLVLDVGCGTGRFSAALADLFDAPLVGIYPAESMLPDAAFGEGVERMKRDADRMGGSGRVIEPIDLFVFGKAFDAEQTAK